MAQQHSFMRGGMSTRSILHPYFLFAEHLLGRTMFVILPADVDPQADERWAGARAEATGFGLQLPSYRDRGGFVRVGEDGAVLKDLPFASLWETGALLEAVRDLLSTPEAMRERLARSQPSGGVSTRPGLCGRARAVRRGLHATPVPSGFPAQR
jgi:hypothetical protein